MNKIFDLVKTTDINPIDHLKIDKEGIVWDNIPNTVEYLSICVGSFFVFLAVYQFWWYLIDQVLRTENYL